MKFENKTAVITGGSRGIGLAIAKKLASQGANIAILYVGNESEGIAAKRLLQSTTQRLSSISAMFPILTHQKRLLTR